MAGALIEGLRKAGREVIDIGEVPTPLAYFGSFHLRTGCCVSVTGSHNPPDYNGFKIVHRRRDASGRGDPEPVCAHRREPPAARRGARAC